MDTNALFMLATKQAFRFSSNQGLLSTEQLWELPLTSRTGRDLDTVAKLANSELRSLTEESFVSTTVNPGRTTAEAKLEVVKAIIAVKQEEAAKSIKKAERAEQRRRLMDILAAKENEELSSASKEDILKKLAELDAD